MSETTVIVLVALLEGGLVFVAFELGRWLGYREGRRR